jgi:Bacteriocin-protection, YdeI or OmpD-Associated
VCTQGSLVNQEIRPRRPPLPRLTLGGDLSQVWDAPTTTDKDRQHGRTGGEFLVGLNREVRDGAAVQAADEAEVTIELDQAPREVEVPQALSAALAAVRQAAASFERMAFTRRKEYARWITEAKREENRRRVAHALEMIRAGKARF